MTLDERVTERLIRAHTRHPPFAVLMGVSLVCMQLDDTPAVEEALIEMFTSIFRYIPDTYKIDGEELKRQHERYGKDRTASVPLHDILTSQGNAINHVMVAVCHNRALGGALAPLSKKILENEASAHGLSLYERRKKRIPGPWEHDEPAEELCKMYLRGTPFFDFFNIQVPFRIERERFHEHGFLFARSGHGKTQALRALCAQFFQERDPPALFLIDSLGSLIEGIEDLEVFNTTLRDRLVILDPSRPQYLPRLNFFGLQSDDMIFYLFKALDQTVTQRQATMISYLMEYMRLLPNPTILQLAELCESKRPLHNEVMAKLSPFAHSFFQNQFYGKGDAFVQQTKSQIAQRLYTLGRLPKFIEIFSATDGAFDPYDCMQSKKIVLINTDARSPSQGGLGEASALFGRFILAQCLEAARRRPKNKRHLALIICDEAKAYLDDQSALILSDARQYGMGMLLASQQPHQLPEGVRREVNTNTSIRFMGNIEYAVASQYARDMFCQPEFIVGMKKVDYSHADWAVHISGMESAVKLRMPYGALEAMPKFKQPPKLEPTTAASSITQNKTHEAPEKGASREPRTKPAEADTTTLPQPADDEIPTSAPGGWKK